MGDYTLQPASTLVVGMHGSGKTTFAFRYLLNAECVCRFIFDDMGRAATRLRVRPAYTARELELSLASRWCVFNPHRMFPGETDQAFKFFCQWVYDVSKRGPGKKLVLVDEVWQWVSPHAIPREFAQMVQAGREENIELVSCTQMPHRLNSSMVGQATELVCFRLQGHLALDCVELFGVDRDTVSKLPLGTFYALNCLTSDTLSGRVF